MVQSRHDPVALAAEKLEAAAARLAAALARPRVESEDGDMVPRAEVAAMAERLNATLAKLRIALADELRAEEG